MAKKRRQKRGKSRPSGRSGANLGKLDAARMALLAQERPAEAAERLTRAYRDAPSKVPRDVDPIALSLCDALRTNPRLLPRAAQLAAAATPRHPDFALQQALASLALGQGEAVAELEGQHERVARLVGPLRRALEGRAEQGGPFAAGSAPGQLLSAARAIGAQDARALRAAIRGAKTDAALPVAECQALGDLLSSRRCSNLAKIRALRTLLASPVLDRPARLEVMRAAAERWGGAALRDAVDDDDVPLEADEDLEVLLRGSDVRATREPAGVASVAADQGPGSLAGVDRATALLWQGHGLADKAPARAIACFDDALAEGADLLECLRGRYRVAERSEGRVPLARACGQLANTLAKAPGGLALAVHLQLEACRQWRGCRQQRHAREALQAATDGLAELGPGAEGLRATAAHMRATAALPKDTRTAAAQLRQALQHDPTRTESWRLLIDLHISQRRSFWQTALEAAEATANPDFASIARLDLTRQLATRGGEAVPPGLPAAPRLALRGVAACVDHRGDGDEVARCLRAMAPELAALQPQERLAAQAAWIACASLLQQPIVAANLLTELLEGRGASDQAGLLATALWSELDMAGWQRVPFAALELSALESLHRLAVEEGAGALSQLLLARVAVRLSRTELKRWRNGNAPAQPLDREVVLGAYDRELAPWLCLYELTCAEEPFDPGFAPSAHWCADCGCFHLEDDDDLEGPQWDESMGDGDLLEELVERLKTELGPNWKQFAEMLGMPPLDPSSPLRRRRR